MESHPGSSTKWTLKLINYALDHNIYVFRISFHSAGYTIILVVKFMKISFLSARCSILLEVKIVKMRSKIVEQCPKLGPRALLLLHIYVFRTMCIQVPWYMWLCDCNKFVLHIIMVKSTQKSVRLRRDNDLAVSSSSPSSGGSICSLAMMCLIAGNGQPSD